jgi:hypothetical protein
VSLDAVLEVMVDGAQLQIILQGLEGRFDMPSQSPLIG